MKKALLTLTMVCALPITSLHAGWGDYIPTTWKKEGTQAEKDALINSAKKWGCGAVAGLGISAIPIGGYTLIAHKVLKMNIVEILTYQQKGGHLQALESIHFPTDMPIVEIANTMINGQFKKLLGGPFKMAMRALCTPSTHPLNLIFAASTFAGLACAAKAGYDFIQAQRIIQPTV